MKKHTFALAAAATALVAVTATAPVSAQVMTTTSATAPIGQTLFTGGDLTVGSRGQSVIDLQKILSELGYLQVPAGTALGYFGELTKAAVSRLQLSLGVPGTGYFGPMTKAAMIESYLANGWISSVNGSYVWGASGTGTTGTGTSGSGQGTTGGAATTTSGTATTTSSTGNASALAADAMRLPLNPQGYWLDGVWYNGMPSATTTASGRLAGYWSMNVWNPLTPAGILGQSSTVVDPQTTVTTPTVPSNIGYWYNNVWYPVTSTRGGGYYSTR